MGCCDKKEKKEGWRLEPEWETETPHVIVLWSEVEGVPENPNSEGHPGEEGEEVKSPKRKVIRVDSEETQDHVREAMDLSQEEAEEISFVPSEISVPPKPVFGVTIGAVKKPSVFGSLHR